MYGRTFVHFNFKKVVYAQIIISCYNKYFLNSVLGLVFTFNNYICKVVIADILYLSCNIRHFHICTLIMCILE